MKSHRPCLVRGISLIEVIVTITIVGVLATIATQALNLSEGTRESKLRTDVRTLNSAIAIYQANGGVLDGVTDAGEILTKLKTSRTAQSAARFVGLGGSMIDPRLVPRRLSDSEAGSAVPRAVWDASRQRFEIADSGDGIKEFYLDDALAEVDFQTEARADSALSYNPDPGWIWAYQDRAPDDYVEPTVVAVADDSPPVSPPPIASPVPLRAPIFTPPGGAYPEDRFPLTVSISNPNPGSTWLMVSINGASFSRNDGLISATPDTLVRAYADGNPAEWV